MMARNGFDVQPMNNRMWTCRVFLRTRTNTPVLFNRGSAEPKGPVSDSQRFLQRSSYVPVSNTRPRIQLLFRNLQAKVSRWNVSYHYLMLMGNNKVTSNIGYSGDRSFFLIYSITHIHLYQSVANVHNKIYIKKNTEQCFCPLGIERTRGTRGPASNLNTPKGSIAVKMKRKNTHNGFFLQFLPKQLHRAK